MVIAHILAASVLTVVLAGAEATAWSLAAVLGTVLLTRLRELLTSSLPTPALAPSARPIGDAPTPYTRHLVGSTPWRGPPVPACA
jgi:hypothetical protein